MLIFDRFPSRDKAEAFASAVTQRDGLSATVYDSQDESNAVDPFPFQLHPPIVLVERSLPSIEQALEKWVSVFGGQVAGT